MKKVLVGGCFDIIHYGHIVFLQKAKAAGNHLIVALESDETVRRLKGSKRPIHTQQERKKMLEELRHVDDVIPLPHFTTDKEYNDFVTALRPEIIATTEGDPIVEKKRTQADAVGAEFVIVPKIHTPSTSQLAKLLGLDT